MPSSHLLPFYGMYRRIDRIREEGIRGLYRTGKRKPKSTTIEDADPYELDDIYLEEDILK